jgi:hypothetical protein
MQLIWRTAVATPLPGMMHATLFGWGAFALCVSHTVNLALYHSIG